MICSSFLFLDTFARVREDMDVSTSTLIGAHGYCTQVWFPLLRDSLVSLWLGALWNQGLGNNFVLRRSSSTCWFVEELSPTSSTTTCNWIQERGTWLCSRELKASVTLACCPCSSIIISVRWGVTQTSSGEIPIDDCQDLPPSLKCFVYQELNKRVSSRIQLCRRDLYLTLSPTSGRADLSSWTHCATFK